MDKKKICFITAVPITATSFLRSHMAALAHDYSVHYVCNAPEEAVASLTFDQFSSLPIERGFSVVKDLRALRLLCRYFKEQKFDAVHSVTPKAGLLTALAGWLARVPVRIHIFTGQVWATRTGFVRSLLKFLDKLIVRLDTHILVDGKSQRAFLEKEGVVKAGRAVVFGNGSISGVDTVRFAPDPQARAQLRRELGVEDNTLVYIFVGRLTRDKGIAELLAAFDMLASRAKDVFLLLVGWDEGGYASTMSRYKNVSASNSRYYGATPAPEKILNAGDVFVLPTYREGFGTSVLEAACVGLPAITSDAYGVIDSTIEGETALRCKVGDVQTLYECMKYFSDHRDQVEIMGRKSRERVLSDFQGERMTQYWVEFYHGLLSE